MLRKFVANTGRHWDKWLALVLFAYRELPQASTGFSPFKLFYGWQVQGPLDLLRKAWEDPASGPEEKGIVQYVLEMSNRFEQYGEKAKGKPTRGTKSSKGWYDQHQGFDSSKRGRKCYSYYQHPRTNC